MNDKNDLKKNDVSADKTGLSQNNFADLFRNLDEEKLLMLLKSAGLSPDDLEEEVRDTEAKAEEDSVDGLTPEMIGILLKSLGDDAVSKLLEDAGLSEELPLEEKETTEAPAEETAEAESPDDKVPEADSAKQDAGDEEAKSKGKVPIISKRLLIIAIIVGALILPFAINKIYLSARLNADEPIQYKTQDDVITCTEGSLIVNNVSVTVPSDGTEEYSISYSWSEEDEQYPSVPHAITALYADEEGDKLYSISLYRNETIPGGKVPSGKTAENWFDDWQVVTDGDIRQVPLSTDHVKGFYITPHASDDGSYPDYNYYTFYFAVQDGKSVYVYVLEGVCLDEDSRENFMAIMATCIKSITIKEPDGVQS